VGTVKQPATKTERSLLRHLDLATINTAARLESRARQHHLPPITTYRWWARRTAAVAGALIDAANVDRPGHLMVADPFAGGGIIALAALMRGHQVYAQDINPWAAQSLATMLALPPTERLAPAAERLHDAVRDLLQRAYATIFNDGTPATIAHTLRVGVIDCPVCKSKVHLYPTALVSLTERVDVGGTTGWVVCPAGHLQRGRGDRKTSCNSCDKRIEPTARYTTQRRFRCGACNHEAKIDTAARMRWVAVLVERTAPGRREIDIPSDTELAAAADGSWPPQPPLPPITAGVETAVLLRHGMTRWDDAFPRRQQAVLHALLAAIDRSAPNDEQAAATLRAAVLGSVEMAGYLSRWDARYLKSYEAVANHRYNFTTLSAEPNVWGAPQSGRGTVNRRLEHLGKAGIWCAEHLGRTVTVDGPIGADSRRMRMSPGIDVRVVAGSSVRLAISKASIDLVCTDPPYHDDVMYGELSEVFRAWAGMGSRRLDGEAVVSVDATDNAGYEAMLTAAFAEIRRVLKPDGHLVLTYANREPDAWVALFEALQNADFRILGYEVVQSENDLDHAKAGRRACNLDLVLDLTSSEETTIEPHQPASDETSTEASFCHQVGRFALRIGNLVPGWEKELREVLRAHPFLRSPSTHQSGVEKYSTA
jgi:putative DNA methylase